MLFDLLFFFNDTATTEIYTLSLHDALPISARPTARTSRSRRFTGLTRPPHQRSSDAFAASLCPLVSSGARSRSEEHTSELQSRQYLVCRLLLEKKKYNVIQFSVVAMQ